MQTKITKLDGEGLRNLNAMLTELYGRIVFRAGDLLFSENPVTPSGWKDISSTYNGKFIRISSGTPLETGGSDTHSHSLSTANIPAHTHGSVSNHNHTITKGGSPGQAGNYMYSIATNVGSTTTGNAGGHTHDSVGSGTSFSANNVPAYVQIRCYKKQ